MSEDSKREIKRRKCKICKKRDATNKHAKDYNHKNLKMPGNCALLDDYCHLAFHQLNQKNNLDWNYMIKNKKQEIIELADKLVEKGKFK